MLDKFRERVRTMVQSWLEIQPAQPQGITIQEAMSHDAQVMAYRVWYRGDAAELDQLYKQLANNTVLRERFWAAAPNNEHLRKIHSGLPGMMVNHLAALVVQDLTDLDWSRPLHKDRWEEIAQENHFPALVQRAVADTLVTGDGAFKITLDPEVSDNPIIEYWSGEQVDYITRRGRIIGTEFYFGTGKYTLKEKRLPGSVAYYRVEDSGKEIPLHEMPELEEELKLYPASYPDKVVLTVPLRFFSSPRWPGRGRSIFDGKTDNFDAFDEICSQWLDAVRSGRVQRYIPENLIPREDEDGGLGEVSRFGTDYVKLLADNRENAVNQIQVVQPDIKYEAFLESYCRFLDLSLQGIISPATLGIDLGKMASADAQREKKDVTGVTRNAITAALEEALPAVARAALQAQDLLEGRHPGEYEPTITFGEYGAPSFDSRVQTIGAAAASGVMSTQALVDELWGSSKEDDWKAAEVKRITREKGIEEMDEPSVGRTGV